MIKLNIFLFLTFGLIARLSAGEFPGKDLPSGFKEIGKALTVIENYVTDSEYDPMQEYYFKKAIAESLAEEYVRAINNLTAPAAREAFIKQQIDASKPGRDELNPFYHFTCKFFPATSREEYLIAQARKREREEIRDDWTLVEETDLEKAVAVHLAESCDDDERVGSSSRWGKQRKIEKDQKG